MVRQYWSGLQCFRTTRPRAGPAYAAGGTVPKVIYKADESGRGFVTAMLSPVYYRREPKFGVRQAMWVATLTFGTMALMRLLLAQ
jgi:hypothetical protein